MNKYIPSWLALSVPPLIIIVLVVNLIMSFMGSLIITFTSKNKDEIIKVLPKKIIKLFLISVLVEVITVILFLIPEIFNSNTFIKDNLITNLETNPYKNTCSFMYAIIVSLINIFVLYLLTNKDVFNKIYKVLLIILLFPYIYFIPSEYIVKKEYKTLDDYKHTTITNSTKIKRILHSLDIKENISSFTVEPKYPYTIEIYVSEIDFDKQMLLEKNANIILSLVEETQKVVFVENNKKYTYNSDDVFKNIKKLKVEEIEKRYEDSNFEEYTYLGRIKEYDIFDTSETCELEHQLLFEYQNIKYYLSCSKLEKVLLYGNNKNLNIKDALNKNIISYEELIDSNIDLIEE